MNLRHHWKKLLLSLTALFWASCNNDSEGSTGAEIIVKCNPDIDNDCVFSGGETIALYGVRPIVDLDSGIVKSSDSCNDCGKNASSSSEKPARSSAANVPGTSSSREVQCHPGDSTISYYGPSFSPDIKKMNASEQAKHDAIDIIDSIVDPRPKDERLQDPLDNIPWEKYPACLKNIRKELNSFVALYGAPEIIVKDLVCDDGTTQPTEDYLKYQKKMEEWEKNKPALEEECNKIYEETRKEIENRIKNCMEK